MKSNSSEEVHLTVFSSMFSLINPKASSIELPAFLSLPPIASLVDEAIKEDSKDSQNHPIHDLEAKRRRKKNQKITACKHKNKKHYARGMCNSCYHRYGRNTYAWLCEHTERKLYAKGMCELCYNKHHIKRVQN